MAMSFVIGALHGASLAVAYLAGFLTIDGRRALGWSVYAGALALSIFTQTL